MLQRAIVAALATSAHSWVTKSQASFGAQISEIQDLMNGKPVDRVVQAQLGFLWTYPESSLDETGLGGGITWAWDPKLCELLTPKFKESVFFYELVTCTDFHAAVARAFDKWAANSRFIKFVDVSNECEKLGMNYGPPTGPAQPSKYPHGGCPLAEIWITSLPSKSAAAPPPPPAGRRLDTEIAIVEAESALSAAVAVATARSHARYTNNFRFTNGERPYTLAPNGDKVYGRKVVETYAGTFSFNVEDICWYLDSEFCSRFHLLKKWMGGASQAKMYVTGITYGVMAIGILVYACVVLRVLCAVTGNTGDDQKEVDEDGDGKLSCCERIQAALRELSSWNPFILAFFIVLIFCPPLLESEIFMPCFGCHDFEATALHEIGHFIGLGHPDNIPDNMYSAGWAQVSGPGSDSHQAFLAAGGRTNSSNCKNLWDGVKPGVSPFSEVDPDRLGAVYPVRNAQMEHQTQHNPRACLTDDDLEALAVLYPDCGTYALSRNVCHRISLNIGWFRIMVYFLGPFIAAMAGILLFSGILHAYADRERKADLKKTRELQAQNEHLKNKRKVEVASKAAKRLTMSLEKKKFESIEAASAASSAEAI